MTETIRRVARVTVCAALGGWVAACATVTRGTHEAWTVQTVPPGAAVKTTTGMACDATPCTFRMERKNSFSVIITKPGYKTYQGQVVSAVAGAGGAAFAGNVLVGGLIGAGVDASDGAMDNLKPDPMVVTLEPADPALPAATATLAPATSAAVSTTPTASEAPETSTATSSTVTKSSAPPPPQSGAKPAAPSS